MDFIANEDSQVLHCLCVALYCIVDVVAAVAISVALG